MNLLRTFVMVAVCGAMTLYSTDAFARKTSPSGVNANSMSGPGATTTATPMLGGWFVGGLRVTPPTKSPDGTKVEQPEERGFFGQLADKQKAKQKPQ